MSDMNCCFFEKKTCKLRGVAMTRTHANTYPHPPPLTSPYLPTQLNLEKQRQKVRTAMSLSLSRQSSKAPSFVPQSTMAEQNVAAAHSRRTTQSLGLHTHYSHTNIHIYRYMYLYIYLYICIYTYIYTLLYVQMSVHIYTFV